MTPQMTPELFDALETATKAGLLPAFDISVSAGRCHTILCRLSVGKGENSFKPIAQRFAAGDEHWCWPQADAGVWRAIVEGAQARKMLFEGCSAGWTFTPLDEPGYFNGDPSLLGCLRAYMAAAGVTCEEVQGG